MLRMPQLEAESLYCVKKCDSLKVQRISGICSLFSNICQATSCAFANDLSMCVVSFHSNSPAVHRTQSLHSCCPCRAHLEVSCKGPPSKGALQSPTNILCTKVHNLATEASAATREFSCMRMSTFCSHRTTLNFMTEDMQRRCTGALNSISCLVEGGKESSGSWRRCVLKAQD